MSAPGGVSAPGVSAQGGVCSRGVPGGDPPTDTAAGGTHPTGMHSCISTGFPLFRTDKIPYFHDFSSFF